MSVNTKDIYEEKQLSIKSDVKNTCNSFCLWCCVHCANSTNPGWLWSSFLSWCLPSAKMRKNFEIFGPYSRVIWINLNAGQQLEHELRFQRFWEGGAVSYLIQSFGFDKRGFCALLWTLPQYYPRPAFSTVFPFTHAVLYWPALIPVFKKCTPPSVMNESALKNRRKNTLNPSPCRISWEARVQEGCKNVTWKPK